MKTLDEVIIGIREQIGLGDPILIDAIRYLKEYKTLQIGYIKAIADLEDNPPLTWDELRQMESKPVWVEEIENDKILYGQWDIISGFGYSENFDLIDYENPIINFYISGNRTKFGLGKTWQAYRKERTDVQS